MRILVLGAGGTGGYFGGRLAQSGADVTFLVRPARAALLRERGLRIRSPLGDADLPVAAIAAAQLPAQPPFDLVLLSCKAYDLDSAIEAVAPAMAHAGAALLPILNGLRHYAALDARFGAGRVLGGLCFISAALGADGEVLHLGRPASITFGERSGDPDSARTRAFAAACAQAGLDHVHSPRIAREQWTKFAFLAALAAGTCLMRADVGTIVAAEGGRELMQALYAECLAAADAAGEPVPEPSRRQALETLTQPGSSLKASMLRDLEAGGAVEAEQIVGDMLRRARAAGHPAPLLAAAWCHLQAYQAGRAARG
ncbi:2-dehydropantoate 2-reductase [Vulcaniibacterium tengchongense]|uniref:2-dehydropantoate 2-reductase n=1 Tax=Vulcaniibacterium tengchongense TaxID=1273429 RepID=A0A3N4VAT3_9GAMM|nr:2-dehydropantoate 2-reductase [Vulcaniibacterium tengchongense]RPE80106.1 ketopantoate reductase [Vulcaniibacterium tengchongense]